MGRCGRARLVVLSALWSAATALGQCAGTSKDDWITPARLGLPAGNARTSEPLVTRIYRTDDTGDILKKQPDGYPFTITSDYTLKENEAARVHEGVDLSSRPGKGKPPQPLEFKAGVHGVVVKAGDGPWGTITVQVRDGSLIQFLHTSASFVKVGDVVAPGTNLGMTGKKGAAVVHLHVQARDSYGNVVSPDLAFRAGQRKLETKRPEKPDPDHVEFDPDAYYPLKPKVAGRKAIASTQPETKWVVEVIGEAGRVDLVLGEFLTYRSALYCSRLWSEANPKDLRLTREREVKLSRK